MSRANQSGRAWVPVDVGIRHHLPEMTGAEAKVYLALWTRYNTTTGQLNPSLERLAADTGLTVTGVKVAARGLRAKGLASSERTGRENYWTLTPITADGTKSATSESAESGLSASAPVSDGPETGLSDGPETGLSDSPESGPSDRPETGPQTTTSIKNQRTRKRRAGARAGRFAPGLPPASRGSCEAEGVPTPPATQTKNAGTEKPTRLNDDLKPLVKSDLTAHAGYWLFGSAAVGKSPDQWAGLAPTQTNWAPISRDFAKPEPEAKGDALAAYCWYRLMCARASVGQPLDLPPFPKLAGIVRRLRRDRMTQDELVGYVDRIAQHWPAILAALSWMSPLPVPNETTLNSTHVRTLCDKLARGESIQPAPPAPKPNTNASLCSVADPAAFGAELDSRIGKVRL